MVAQLIKTSPASYGNPKIHYSVNKTPILDIILRWMNSDHTLISCFLKIHFNILSNLFLGLYLSCTTKCLYPSLTSPHACYLSCLSHPHINPIIIFEEK
jgi:hypothetical protein